MTNPVKVLSESEARLESFHDCHVHGIHWRRDQYIFFLDIQYILEWIQPTIATSGSYRFLVSEARLIFKGVDGIKISMDWSHSALDSGISSIRVLNTRMTPKGYIDRLYEIDFTDPKGIITFWSLGYEVALLGEPLISNVPSIPIPEDI